MFEDACFYFRVVVAGLFIGNKLQLLRKLGADRYDQLVAGDACRQLLVLVMQDDLARLSISSLMSWPMAKTMLMMIRPAQILFSI